MKRYSRFGVCIGFVLLAACVSGRLVLDEYVSSGKFVQGQFQSRWADLLADRYQCDSTVVNNVRFVQWSGSMLLRRIPTSNDIGMSVCNLAAVSWPVRIKAYRLDGYSREEWEYYAPTMHRPIIIAFLSGPSPERLRVTFVSPR